MYIMLTGEPPFNGKNNNIIFKRILSEEVTYPIEKFKNISKEALDLLKKCLVKTPNDRLSGEEALSHPWFNKVYQEIHHKNKIDLQILNNLKNFSFSDKFQKMILKYVVNTMNDDDIDHLKEVFQAIDTNHTGCLNNEEISDAFKKVGVKISKEEVEEIINKIEDNDHGKINYSEFLLAAMDFKKNVDKEKLISAFSYFDIDKTGKIEIRDIEEAMLRSGKKILDKSELYALISNANKGKDTLSISLDEFLGMFGYTL